MPSHETNYTTPPHTTTSGTTPQQHNLSYNPKLATVPPDIMTFNGTAFQYQGSPTAGPRQQAHPRVVPRSGHDNFVSHAMSYAEKGQQETFEVTE